MTEPLFATEAELEDERNRQATDAYNQTKSTRPDTGEQLPDGYVWCGRCGETVHAGALFNTHDIGYCGCPVETDPVFRTRKPLPGFRRVEGVTSPMGDEHLTTRWDRAYFADCTCGHPWGLHGLLGGGGNNTLAADCLLCACQAYVVDGGAA